MSETRKFGIYINVGSCLLATLAVQTLAAHRSVYVFASVPYDLPTWFDSKSAITSGGEIKRTAHRNVAFGEVLDPLYNGTANSFALAGEKKLRVSTKASFATGHGSPDGQARAETIDSLTLESPDYAPGEIITFVFGIRVSGNLFINAEGTSTPLYVCSVAFSVLSNGQEILDLGGYLDEQQLPDQGSISTGVHYVNITCANNTAVSFRQVVSVSAETFSTGTGDQSCLVQANYGHSFTWQGVTSVTDSDGNPITNYTLTDEFGHDWTTAAPESGDINCDGAVNGADIQPFILAIAAPASYSAAFPDCPLSNADVNFDFENDALDVGAMVQLLLNF